MLKLKDRTNLNIKKRLLPEIDSELNRFKKSYNNENNKSPLLKYNNSYTSNEEIEDSNENKKITSVLNDIDIISLNNSTNNNQKKSPNTENKENDDPFKIYEEIKMHIEKFLEEYVNDSSSLFYILKEILNSIIIIITDFKENNKNNNSSIKDNKDNLFLTRGDGETLPQKSRQKSHLNPELDINSKIVFLLKIQKLENKIKKLNEEMTFFRSVIDIPKKGKVGENFIEVIKKKFLEQKFKNKKEEMNYLLCIRDQDKKIHMLENKLKNKEKENLPKEVIKAIRCFPNFHQYNFKEDINPKSVPLFQQFQKEKNKEKYLKKEMFDSPKKVNDSKSKKKLIINNSCSNNRNKKFLTNSELNKIKNNEFTSFRDNKEKFVNLSKIKKFENVNNNMKTNNSEAKIKKHFLKTETSNMNSKNLNNIYLDFKNYSPKTILDNNREFFIAHPTLGIAGVIKKKEIKYVGLPKKIIRLKVHKSLENNMLISFPSTINETLVNLEKLRKCKINDDNDK